jgi:SPP1 family predicted phage head-tail adaptor
MRAGTLRHRISIQAKSSALDALSQPVMAWQTIATISAGISPLSGRELMSAQAIHAEITHQIEIRWQAQFSNPLDMVTMRIRYGTRVFNIVASIDPEERHKSLMLMATEGMNDG